MVRDTFFSRELYAAWTLSVSFRVWIRLAKFDENAQVAFHALCTFPHLTISRKKECLPIDPAVTHLVETDPIPLHQRQENHFLKE